MEKVTVLDKVLKFLDNYQGNDDSYTEVIRYLKANYSNLSNNVRIESFEISSKHHEITMNFSNYQVQIDILKNAYIKININSYKFTYMIDNVDYNKLKELLDEFFKGNYILNVFSKRVDSKTLENEIIWENTDLKEFNQRIKVSICSAIFPIKVKKTNSINGVRLLQ